MKKLLIALAMLSATSASAFDDNSTVEELLIEQREAADTVNAKHAIMELKEALRQAELDYQTEKANFKDRFYGIGPSDKTPHGNISNIVEAIDDRLDELGSDSLEFLQLQIHLGLIDRYNHHPNPELLEHAVFFSSWTYNGNGGRIATSVGYTIMTPWSNLKSSGSGYVRNDELRDLIETYHLRTGDTSGSYGI